MQVIGGRQLSDVEDPVRAKLAMVVPVLKATLHSLARDRIQRLGGLDRVTLCDLAREFREGHGDAGICFEYAVHDAIATQNRLIWPLQQLFNLGVTSHMANVAFDRHVAFSEQYISRMQKGLTELFQTGPRGESLKICSDLIDIRLSFRAWITEDLETKVMPFEDALRQIGAKNIVLEGLAPGTERTRVVNEMYEIFSDVTGLKREGQVDERLAPRRIISHLQDLLEVQQLSRLRRAVVQAAIDGLERKT